MLSVEQMRQESVNGFPESIIKYSDLDFVGIIGAIESDFLNHARFKGLMPFTP